MTLLHAKPRTTRARTECVYSSGAKEAERTRQDEGELVFLENGMEDAFEL